MNAIVLRPKYLLAALVLFAAFLLNSQSSRQISTAPRFDVKEISVPEAKALIDTGAVVIDVRDRAVSAVTHVPGALLIPIEMLELSSRSSTLRRRPTSLSTAVMEALVARKRPRL